ncbi:MAG: AI-2E family transporter [Polyangiaceae bacterium]|nr:AI-2E family transporter [Polyangiaceae bacterium]
MERSDRWLSFTLRTALIALFFWMVKGLLIPVVLGGLVALLLDPVKRRLAPRLGRLRRFAPAALTVGTLVVFGIPITLIVVEVVSSINRLVAGDLSATADRFQTFITSRMAGITDTLGVSIDQVRAYVADLAQRAGEALARLAGGAAAALPSSIIGVFLFVVALHSFLRDGPALTRWMARLSPFEPGETAELFASIRDTVNGAVLGLLATALVQGTLTTTALLIFKVPSAVLLGVVAMFLSMVPLIGTTPVTVGSAIYLLISGRIGAAIGMIAAAFVVGVSDNVVRPWVQSAGGRMHPLLALLSIFGGLELFGFAGIFIGPIVGAMAVWTIDAYASVHTEGRARGAGPGA